MAGKPGKSGRRREPAATKKLRGTYRKDRDSTDLEEFRSQIPPVIEGLHDKAIEEWGRLAPLCAKRGLLTEADWIAWELLFRMYSIFLTVSDAILKKTVLTEEAESGYRYPIPEISIAKQAWACVNNSCHQFGLTPSARTGLKIADGKKETVDPLEEFLTGK